MKFSARERLGAEFDQEPSASFRKQRESFGIDALGALVIDEEVVETFEANGLVLEDFWNVVGALVDVGIGHDQENSMWRAFDEATGGFESGGAGSF